MSVDTVNDVTPRIQYTALAAQTDFDYPFPIFANADLVVDIDGVTQALTTDYTVSGAGDDAGGTVTLLVAATGGEIVTIYRDLPIERLTDFQQNGPFSTASFNDELDKIIMIQQQLAGAVGRALRIPQADTTSSAAMELPVPSSRLGKFLYFNAITGAPELATTLADNAVLSASTVGAVLYPRTAEEIAAGVTPTAYYYPFGDIRRYGAVAGAVSTAAIQAAASVGRIHVPFPFVFLIDGQITLISNTLVDGGGEIKLANSSVANLTNGPMLYADSLSDVTIRGISLNGNKANNDTNSNYGDGIRVYANSRLRIEKCRIYNHSRDGISIAKHPTTGSNTDVEIVGNIVTGCGATSQTTGGEGILVVEGSRIVVTDNICTGNKYRGIEVETLTSTIEDIEVSDNICKSNARGIGINGATDVVVADNVLSANTTSNLSIESSVVVNGFIEVSGNKISDSAIGIDLQNYDHVNINGNMIHDNTTGVKFEDCTRCEVVNNHFSNNTSHVDTASGTNTNLIIRNNAGYVTEAAGLATITSGATTVVVTHGLSYTPAVYDISLTPAEQGSNDYGRFWVSTITSTQFTINVSADPGASNLDVAWSVRKV